MRFNSAMLNFRFSVGCVCQAPHAVMQGPGASSGYFKTLKNRSDCSPGFNLSHSAATTPCSGSFDSGSTGGWTNGNDSTSYCDCPTPPTPPAITAGLGSSG